MWTTKDDNDTRACLAGPAGLSGLPTLALVALALVAGVAGCAGEQTFPPEVPRQPGGSAWVDPPLEQRLSDERSKIREVIAGFLVHQQARACRPSDSDESDRTEVSRRVVEQARARVMHAHSRAELLGEQMSMRGRDLKKGIDLTPILAFDAAKKGSKLAVRGLLKGRCEQLIEDACVESIANRSTRLVYARLFDVPQISRAATAKVLPALRRDLEWGLVEASDVAGPHEVSSRIEKLCLEGESPLANFLIEHVDAEDDQLVSLVRRLGGRRPCADIAGMYSFLMKSLVAQLVAATNEQVCSTGGVGHGITARLSARSSKPSLTEMEPRRYSRAKAITDSKS